MVLVEPRSATELIWSAFDVGVSKLEMQQIATTATNSLHWRELMVARIQAANLPVSGFEIPVPLSAVLSGLRAMRGPDRRLADRG